MSYRKKHVKSKILKNKPKKSILKLPIFWYFLLFLIIILTGLYFLLFFSNFQVNNIIISGNEKINSQDLQNVINDNINRKIIELGNWNISSQSIFLIATENIKNKILNSYPIIENLTVTKKFPQDLNVQIEERKQFAIFCQNDNCFNIDDNGVIFGNSSIFKEDYFIVRQSQNYDDLFLGKNVVHKNLMTIISEIEKNLKDNFQINLTEALISTPIRLDIKTGESWQIYFDIDENCDIKLQLTKLNLLLRGEITPEIRQKLEYVDLRFKDRAYYK